MNAETQNQSTTEHTAEISEYTKTSEDSTQKDDTLTYYSQQVHEEENNTFTSACALIPVLTILNRR